MSLAVEVAPFATAMVEIGAERMRQVTVEGYTPEHDDLYAAGELAAAAACYAAGETFARVKVVRREDGARRRRVECLWPWGLGWWKPGHGDRRRDLIRAGALIVAELERLERAANAVREPAFSEEDND
jgi:hypothetical protein